MPRSWFAYSRRLVLSIAHGFLPTVNWAWPSGNADWLKSVPAAFLYPRQIDESEDIWLVLIERFSYSYRGQKRCVVGPRYSPRVSSNSCFSFFLFMICVSFFGWTVKSRIKEVPWLISLLEEYLAVDCLSSGLRVSTPLSSKFHRGIKNLQPRMFRELKVSYLFKQLFLKSGGALCTRRPC